METLLLIAVLSMPFSLPYAMDALARRRAHRALRERLLADFPDVTGIWWTPDVRDRIEEIKAKVSVHYNVRLGDFEMVWPSGASMTITRQKGLFEAIFMKLRARLRHSTPDTAPPNDGKEMLTYTEANS